VSPDTAAPALATSDDAAVIGHGRHFTRGVLLAISSPTAILWFAAVGGALIAKTGATTVTTVPVFLGGFFVGGVCWSVFPCMIAARGRQRAGAGLLRACHVVSALLFAYFTYSVIVNGYCDLILRAAQALPAASQNAPLGN
jgi:L-lysine exporter family protein LysE/ArgO